MNVSRKQGIDWVGFGLLLFASACLLFILATQYQAKREALLGALKESSQLQIDTYNRVLDVWVSEKISRLDSALRFEVGERAKACPTDDCVGQHVRELEKDLATKHGVTAKLSIQALDPNALTGASPETKPTNLRIDNNEGEKRSHLLDKTVTLTHRTKTQTPSATYEIEAMFSASKAIHELYRSELDEKIIDLVLYDHEGNQFDLMGRDEQQSMAATHWRGDDEEQNARQTRALDISELIDKIIMNHHEGRVVEGDFGRGHTYTIWSDDGDFGYGMLAVVDVAGISSMVLYAKLIILMMLTVIVTASLTLLFFVTSVRGTYREKTEGYLNELKENIDSRTEQLYAVQRRLNQTNRELQKRVDVDSLTGIATRRGFFGSAKRDWNATETESASILMIDVDHFKGINDTYGHLVGDQCLEKITSVIDEFRKNIKSIKGFGRYGGEEFIMLCTNMSPAKVYELGEAIRKEVAKAKMSVPYHGDFIDIELRVSVGIGYTPTPSKTNMRTIIEDGDKALYSAKRLGRDKAIIHESSIQRIRLNG